MGTIVGDGEPVPGLQQMLDWLLSPQAHAFASNRTRGTDAGGHIANDAISATIEALLDKHATGRLPQALEKPVGYAVAVLRRKCADLCNARDVLPLQDRIGARAQDDRGTSDVVPDVVSADAIDSARLCIAGSAEELWVRSGALTALALADLDEVPSAFGVTFPQAGANRVQRVMWPALWFAGRRDCVDPGATSAAARQQRSRCAKRIRALVDAAIATLGVAMLDGVTEERSDG